MGKAAMRPSLKGEGGLVQTGGGGAKRGTINANAAQTPRPGAAQTKFGGGGTPAKRPITMISGGTVGSS